MIYSWLNRDRAHGWRVWFPVNAASAVATSARLAWTSTASWPVRSRAQAGSRRKVLRLKKTTGA